MVGTSKVKKTVKHMSKTELQKHLGGEPNWDTERALKFENAEFEHYLAESLRYYGTHTSSKVLKKYVVEWVQENMKLSKEQLALYIQSDADQTSMSVCGLVKAELVGMPMREKNKKYIVDSITKIIESQENKKAKTEKKKDKPVVNIQDRLAEKTSEIIGEIEGEVDNVFLNKPTANIYEFITAKNLVQSHISKVKSHFQKQIDEITMVVGGKDDQLNESYSFLKNKDLKRIGEFYVKMMADLDSYASVKKATKKLQVKRPQNKDKLVANLKYLKESKDLKIVSVSPIEILGAQEIWIFDVKTRKIYHYMNKEFSELGVKGTTITGFDDNKSIGKTLRKPVQQLSEFIKLGKVALRTFVKNIKTVEVKASGRINANCLLLKVI